MAYSALAPVSEAVYGVLVADSTLMSLLTGVHNDVPDDPTFPFCLFEVREEDQRGFGTGEIPMLELRTHVYSERGGSLAGIAQGQEANRQIVALLKDVALTVTGYTACGHIFFRETVPLPDEVIQGVKVHELVSRFNLWMEAA